MKNFVIIERTSQGARFAQLPDNFSLKVCILGDVLFVDFVDPKTNEVFFATFICIDEEEHKDFGDFTPTGRQLLLERLTDAIVNDVSAFIGSENDHGIEYGLPIGDELKSTTLKNTEHQVCMAHTKARFVKAEDSGGDSQAHVFNECFKRLYGLEHLYDKEGIYPEERCKRRQGLETKEIMITLRQHLTIQLEKLKPNLKRFQAI